MRPPVPSSAPRRFEVPRVLSLCLGLWVLLHAEAAEAVRPFVTDDARIVDRGQFELEMWPEFMFVRGETGFAYNAMAGLSVTSWLEIIAGGGVGIGHDRAFSVPNPVVQSKFLVLRAGENGVPGVAFVVGATLPVGHGEMHENAAGVFLIAPFTSRLFDDWLQLHVNLGVLVAHRRTPPIDRGATSARPYWGVGADVGVVHPDARLVIEAYAGDPFHPLGPRFALQAGARWLTSDTMGFDLTFGAQPLVIDEVRAVGEWEFWLQIGARFLFDVFTDGPGDPQGGAGMLKRAHGP